MSLSKRGYFFILDAVIALFILVIGIFLLSSYRVSVHSPSQVSLLSDDVLKILSNKKIKDFNNPYIGIGGELWRQGNITDPENTLLQQLGEFYATNKMELANKSIQNITVGIVPPQFNYEVWMNGVILYPQPQTPEHIRSKANTNLMLTSKKITFGVINKTTSKIWGPYKAEVYIWQTGSSKISVTDYNACFNAQNSGSCDGLDIIYWAGYKCSCCSEHSFCCSGC